ncbi:MAG: benzoyl-CoA reductase subunit D [Planctomycetes bacterium]|nr:benzoyl-CoA reductase subunit D [Planctomycetota bacterium]
MGADDAEARTHLTLGVDPGASAVKVVVARSRAGRQGEVLGRACQRIRRRPVATVVQACVEEARAQAGVPADGLDYMATTGDGDGLDFQTGHFYSMTTHARGALELAPEVRSALDMGALHGRALRFDERGRVLNHRMTSQCASGSGQFLENIARYLGVPLEDVGRLSLEATRPESVSSICAVLAETDVINMVSRGIGTADILRGIHRSIAGRLVRLLRAIGAEGEVLLTGGLAADAGLLAALNETLEEEAGQARTRALPSLHVRTHPEAHLAGALGAALLGAYRHEQLERSGRRADLASAP